MKMDEEAFSSRGKPLLCPCTLLEAAPQAPIIGFTGSHYACNWSLSPW